MTEQRFEIPRRFDPTRSVFGRLVRRHDDPLQSEARYYFGSVMMLTAILIANFFAWAVLKSAILADPLGSVAIVYWIAQVISIGSFSALCIVGFQNGTTVTVTDGLVSIIHGDELVTLRRSRIDDVRVVSALLHHRHYRRYSNVTTYAAAASEAYVILRVAERVFSIGLKRKDALDLGDAIRASTVPREEAVRVAL